MNILWLTFIAVILRIRLLYGQTEYSGKIVEPGDFPFVVSIDVVFTTIPSVPAYYYCLGAIISPNWVLTVPGCTGTLPDMKYVIQYGAWGANETGKITTFIDSIAHPEHVRTAWYSIRLLRTKYPIQFDNFTQAVRLIPQNKQVPPNSKGFTIAWGSNGDLEVYNSTILAERKWHSLFTERNFEVKDQSTGAPLISAGDLIGLFSVGEVENKCLYSDLSIHLNWIYKTITFYDFKEEYSYLKNVEPNCTGTLDSNDILDICCTYPFGYDLLELCTSLE